MKKATFKINYNYTGFGNEFKSIEMNGREYIGAELSNEAIELLTAMSYEDYECTVKYFEGIAQMIGYETTVQGIKDLAEINVNVASAQIYRVLVMNSFKNKYKGMWR